MFQSDNKNSSKMSSILGPEIEIKGVTHLIVRESELLGMIEG